MRNSLKNKVKELTKKDLKNFNGGRVAIEGGDCITTFCLTSDGTTVFGSKSMSGGSSCC